MSHRTFTVFQDAPSSDTSKHNPSNTSTKSLTPLSNSSLLLNHATTLTTSEKENVHPLTGERAGPSNTKKRKTSVLATKAQTPLGNKKQKESKETQPDAKKRKSSSTSTAKVKTSSKKDSKTSTSSRKTAKKPLRKVSPMPKVEEEVETDRERDRIVQADIDSRCYELTVQPLADVSQAYEQSASIESLVPSDEKVRFQSVKESSVEPEIRDYFSPPPTTCAPPASTIPKSRLSEEDRGFSTPERKQIYAAFTFTSPSPTSERFSQAKRGGSVPRLELV